MHSSDWLPKKIRQGDEEDMKNRTRAARCAVFVFLTLTAAVWIIPIIWAVFTSFKTETEIKTKGFGFLPKVWTAENYVNILQNTDNAPIVRWFVNSMVMAVAVVLLSLIIVSLTAYGYSRLKFKYRDQLFYTIMAISLFPSVINIIPLYKIISVFDWVNNAMAMIIPGLGGVTNIFLVRQFSLGIPKEFDEAARIDGAGEFRIFTMVILPMLKPVLTVVALFSFTGVWNDFLWPTIVFNDVEKMPLTAGLQLLQGAYGGFQLGPILAAACIAMIPTFLLYLFAQKYFLQSMSLSAGVKG